MLGSKDAPVTVVEFSDYQCPFCQRFHTQVYSELKKDFIDTGKVRFYSRDLPIDQLHPNATRAAQAARCAGDQGQFWALRDIMSAHPEALDLTSLVADASAVKINPDTFRKCVETEKYKEAVKGDLLEAMKIGADGTPVIRRRQEHPGWRGRRTRSSARSRMRCFRKSLSRSAWRSRRTRLRFAAPQPACPRCGAGALFQFGEDLVAIQQIATFRLRHATVELHLKLVQGMCLSLAPKHFVHVRLISRTALTEPCEHVRVDAQAD